MAAPEKRSRRRSPASAATSTPRSASCGSRPPSPTGTGSSAGRTRAWTELAGDCIGRPLAEHVAPESTHEQRRQFSRKVLGTARTTDYQLNMLGTDGSHVPIEVSAVVVEGTDHRIVGVFGTIRPVAPAFQPPPLPLGLTPRQLEVLHHLAHGASTAQIADTLGIQRETVRNHVRGILQRSGCTPGSRRSPPRGSADCSPIDPSALCNPGAVSAP